MAIYANLWDLWSLTDFNYDVDDVYERIWNVKVYFSHYDHDMKVSVKVQFSHKIRRGYEFPIGSFVIVKLDELVHEMSCYESSY